VLFPKQAHSGSLLFALGEVIATPASEQSIYLSLTYDKEGHQHPETTCSL
jgi:hypothetical protein